MLFRFIPVGDGFYLKGQAMKKCIYIKAMFDKKENVFIYLIKKDPALNWPITKEPKAKISQTLLLSPS